MLQIHKFILPMFLLASIAASGPVAPAYAAGGGAESEGGNSNKTLDLSNLVVPVERDGELINYLFVSVVVTVNDGQDHWKLRERAHVLRDVLDRPARAEHAVPAQLVVVPRRLHLARAQDFGGAPRML